MKVIVIVRTMGLMCEMKSMQGMTIQLNTEEAIFEKVKIEEIEEIRKYMINSIFLPIFYKYTWCLRNAMIQYKI